MKISSFVASSLLMVTLISKPWLSHGTEDSQTQKTSDKAEISAVQNNVADRVNTTIIESEIPLQAFAPLSSQELQETDSQDTMKIIEWIRSNFPLRWQLGELDGNFNPDDIRAAEILANIDGTFQLKHSNISAITKTPIIFDKEGNLLTWTIIIEFSLFIQAIRDFIQGKSGDFLRSLEDEKEYVIYFKEEMKLKDGKEISEKVFYLELKKA